MEIPERGEEGYLVTFSEDELEELKRVLNRSNLTMDAYVNYEPENVYDRFFIFNDKGGYTYVIELTTRISVEQLKQLMFIDSLEN